MNTTFTYKILGFHSTALAVSVLPRCDALWNIEYQSPSDTVLHPRTTETSKVFFM